MKMDGNIHNHPYQVKKIWWEKQYYIRVKLNKKIFQTNYKKVS
jgi:hypothetical protein